MLYNALHLTLLQTHSGAFHYFLPIIELSQDPPTFLLLKAPRARIH